MIVDVLCTVLATENGTAHGHGVDVNKSIAIAGGRPGRRLPVNSVALMVL